MKRPLLAILLHLLLAGALSSAASAQTVASPETAASHETEEPAATSEDRLAEIQRKQSDTAAQRKRREEELAAAHETELVEGSIVRELELLERIEYLYEEQLGLAERAVQLERLWQESEHRLSGEAPDDLEQDPPFSLVLLDSLERRRDNYTAQIAAGENILREMERNLASAQTALEARQVEARQDRELAEQATSGEVEGARAVVGVDELESLEAAARLDLASMAVENARRDLELQERERDLAARAVAWVGANLEQGEDILKVPLSALEDREFALKREQHDASRDLDRADRRLEEALGRLDRVDAPEPVLYAEVEAKRAARLTAQRRAFLATKLLQRVSEDRELWERRRRNLEGIASRAELWTWQKEIEQQVALRRGDGRILGARAEELRLEIEEFRGRAELAAAAGLPRARWVRQHTRHLEDLLQLHEETADQLREGRELAARVLGEVQAKTALTTFEERLGTAVKVARRVSRFELFAVDQNSITLAKVVEAAVLFMFGFLLARLASRLVGKLVLRRTGGAVGAASAVQGLTFYVLLLLSGLFALRVVNIPLTAFTVAGGALAIGIGFGSQNLINNFLSGIILMAERPIKVGDLIEVDGTHGKVERIGPRSTRVRTFANTHIIIPNSAFLETSVVNWTHTDDDVRTTIDVGVAYGSPTHDVDRLIRRAVAEHGQILKSPESTIFFAEFGESALLFRVNFWIRSRDMQERLRIESDIRYRVDHLFREAGVEIAFPQRDVHLSARQPLEVRVVGAGRNEEPNERG